VVHVIAAQTVAGAHLVAIDLALVIGLGVLYAVVLPIAVRASRTVRAQAIRLDEQTRQIAALVEQMPAVVWTTDRDLRLLETAGAGLQGAGVASNEHRGRTIAEVFGTGDPAHPAVAAHRRALEGETASYESEFDGRTFQGSVQPLRDRRRIVGTVGAAFDVTDRKVAERSLDRLQRQHALILDSAGEGILGIGIRGNVTFVNAAAARMLGWERHELLGRNIHAVSHHSYEHGAPYPAEECPTNLTLQDGRIREVSNDAFWRSDGTGFDVEYVVAPLRMEDRLVGAVLVFRDVTQRRRDERELRRNFSLLRKSHEERRRLVGQLVRAEEEERRRIAGDIHDDSLQVMAAVAMHLYNVRRHVDDEHAAGALKALEETVQTSIGRLRHLLFELRPTSLDREGLAAALRLLLEETVQPLGVTWEVASRVTAEPPQSARTILYRIAQEALANVRKHARAKHVGVTIDEQRGGYLVRIEDDGRGTSVEPGGSARPGHLGLAAMRERAEVAGGWFRFGSEPGAGTRVEFFIPAEEPATGAVAT
jgi:PAS domain S-box-containing protein